MKKIWIRFWQETQGQDLIEYALISAAIALSLVAAVQGIAQALSSLYLSIQTGLTLSN